MVDGSLVINDVVMGRVIDYDCGVKHHGYDDISGARINLSDMIINVKYVPVPTAPPQAMSWKVKADPMITVSVPTAYLNATRDKS